MSDMTCVTRPPTVLPFLRPAASNPLILLRLHAAPGAFGAQLSLRRIR
ncbi:hypothetical protein [Burkholderia territorii]|nr:hypothetical protein [Burkholderia territorii]